MSKMLSVMRHFWCSPVYMYAPWQFPLQTTRDTKMKAFTEVLSERRLSRADSISFVKAKNISLPFGKEERMAL
jgi:hypothetical protein